MSTTAITFVVDANVGPAQAKVDAVQAAFEDAAGAAKTFGGAVGDAEKSTGSFGQKTKQLATAVEAVDARIRKTVTDMDALSAAIRRGDGPVEAYREELRRMQGQLEAMSGAAHSANSAVASVAGGAAKGFGGMGQGVLQLSQTLDDLQYGIRGVVNNIPGLVTGLGLGAGVAGAAQLAFIAVNQLTDKLTAYIKRQQEATQAAIKGRMALLDTRIGAMTQTADLERELAKLEAQAGATKSGERAKIDIIKTAEEQRIEIETRKANAQAQLEDLIAIGRERVKQNKFNASAVANLTDAERKRYEFAKLSVAASVVQREELDKQLVLRLKIIDAEERLSDTLEKKTRTKKVKDPYESDELSGMFSTAGLRNAIAAREAQEAAELQDASSENFAKATEIGMAALKDRLAQERQVKLIADTMEANDLEKKQNAIRESWAAVYSDLGDLARASASVAIGATQDYIKMRIEGAENAEQIVAAKFLEGVGNQLVGVGTKYAFEGAGMTILGDPRGPLLAGLGVTAIGAGIAMGAGGAALAHTAAGGVVGQKIPEKDDRSANERGASPSRGGSSGGGGGLVVNVSFGAGGPHPEDIAREIHKVIRTDDRRRGAA